MTALTGDGWGPPLVAALAAVLVAAAGAGATTTDSWYRRLHVPSWKPPDWVFGPVWTIIFALTATSGVLAWNADASVVSRAGLVGAFTFNAVLNIGWSVIFFRMRRPDWAFIEVVMLWVSIVALMVVVGRVSLPAAFLNLPYLAWVGTAAFLNLQIVRMNPQLEQA